MTRSLKTLGISSLVFAVAVGLIGTGPAFGIWPWSTEEKNVLININTADQVTLATLPGVEEAEAKAIIEYRQKNGPFKAIEEIKNVPGIGEQVLTNIKGQITVGEGVQSSSKEISPQSSATIVVGEEE